MTTALIETVGKRKVRFSREAVRLFHRHWPAHGMSEDRSYWFEFDASGDLVDTDVPEHSDGAAAAALADEAREYLQRGVVPPWLPSSNPRRPAHDLGIRSWWKADTFLGKKERRPLANNTEVIRRGEDIAVRLHRTDIVLYHADKVTVTVATGGWNTRTTRARINELLPHPWGVSNEGRLNRDHSGNDLWLTYAGEAVAEFEGTRMTFRTDRQVMGKPSSGYDASKNPPEPIDMPGGYGDDTISGYIDSRKEGAKMMSFDGVDTGWRLDAVLKEYRTAEGDRRVAVRLRKYPTKSKSVNRPVFFAGGLLLLDDGSLFRGTRISLRGPEFAPSTWQQMDRLALDEAEHWLSVDADDEASGLFDEEE